MIIDFLKIKILLHIIREGGDNGLFILWYPKIYNNAFLFLGPTTVGTFIKFLLVGSLNVSTNNCNLKNEYFCVSSSEMYIILLAIVLSL